LCCSARGASLAEARARAYALVDGIALEGKQVRRDIGASVAPATVPAT
jgi:phosphoribosylamine-glycine ligase